MIPQTKSAGCEGYHTIVEVQGAGNRYSGKYYVTGVKHIIDASAYKMELELARNAWGN